LLTFSCLNTYITARNFVSRDSAHVLHYPKLHLTFTTISNLSKQAAFARSVTT